MKKFALIPILLILTLVIGLGGAAFAEDSHNDGLDDGVDLSSTPTASSVTTSAITNALDILIVHDTLPLAFFGWYRANQMSATGFDVLQRTIDWADGGLPPANTDVIHFTYNGTLDPLSASAELGPIAVQDYLVAAGYNVVEVHPQSDVESLPASHYSSFDLAIYSWTFPRDATNIVTSGIPFISFSAGETDEMGIGNGNTTMHASKDSFHVVNNTHQITQPYPLGTLNFGDFMFTDASEASGSGIALIIDESLGCHGAQATIVGTSGPDLLIGTPGVDVIMGLDGNDVILGYAGDDIICAGNGNDVVDSGDGDDLVDGEPGADRISAGPGADHVIGGAGHDLIAAGAGDDLVEAGSGNDNVSGGSGRDVMFGDAGHDYLAGDTGEDMLLGGSGSDEFDCGADIDIADGGPGADVVPAIDCELVASIP